MTKSATSLRDAMLADLKRSGLLEAAAKKLGMVPTDAKGCEKLGLSPAAAGYVIPYFDVHGKKTGLYRFRYLEDVRTGFQKASKKKVLRYIQPANTDPGVYFSPLIKWGPIVEDPEKPVLITEGEKKAAVGSTVIPTIGLGGVWSFGIKKQGVALLPELADFKWKGRLVGIVYDSDAVDNPQVRKAELALANELMQRGATVRIVRLPPAADGAKAGLDDFLVAEGPESLKALLNDTEDVELAVKLQEMNEKVVLIRADCTIYSFADDKRYTASNFMNALFANDKMLVTDAEGKGKLVSTAKAWLEWRERGEVRNIVYEPGEETPFTADGNLNRWKGFAVEPQKGDVSPWTALLDHLFQGEPEAREWFERWAAFPVQYPGAKLRTAAAVWGVAQGTGKSLLGFTLKDLYGENGGVIRDKDLEGNSDFNEWQRHKQFIVGEEVTGHASRKLANRLKALITSETITINEKHVPIYTIRDTVNYFFSSNNADAFYMDEGDRRFFIHEVRVPPLGEDFYRRFDKWRHSHEGKAALMHHLRTLPLGSFNPMAPALVTQAKREMIADTRTDLEMRIISLRDDPETDLQKFGGGDLLTSKELRALLDPDGTMRINEATIGRKMKEYGFRPLIPKDTNHPNIRLGEDRARVYALKNASKWHSATIELIRAHWEKNRPHLKRGK